MQILKSSDGSSTIFNEEFQQCYHSLKDGAYTETLYKHILPPIYFGNLFGKKTLKILDICFGLGYNSFLTALYYSNMNYQGNIEIFSPEKDDDIFNKILCLEYPNELLKINIPRIVDDLKSKGESIIFSNIKLKVYFGDALKYLEQFEEKSIDIVYQDPFSLKVNMDLWSEAYFTKMLKITHKDSIVTTYSVNQEIYKKLRDLGFFIYQYHNGFVRKSSLFSRNKLLENEHLVQII
ncbi:MnmC family methyltransferase [Helicobacter sp. 13S00477-4]|uniref:MnmC family methyltransferase n=1 Tax=Helicobacter sp. 13S00477-4 TaxID=1905759 RepID=UPI000BA5AB0D|nr:MnmC family methyltransferase [Helicobacter sp. 13S00477-4]PAF52753.1 hypothetical protein BKH44_00790 [Helicobacter sp. 13S00477-4]